MGFPVFTLATEDLRKLSEQGTERRLPREGRRLGGERELLLFLFWRLTNLRDREKGMTVSI